MNWASALATHLLFLSLLTVLLVNTVVNGIVGRRFLALLAADAARRHMVRDLHDGVQQRLVHMIIMLKQAAQALPADHDPAGSLVAEALAQGAEANAELRELVHGIMPAVLTRGGEWVRYSTPDGAEYVAVCLPAFSPDTVHRDES